MHHPCDLLAYPSLSGSAPHAATILSQVSESRTERHVGVDHLKFPPTPTRWMQRRSCFLLLWQGRCHRLPRRVCRIRVCHRLRLFFSSSVLVRPALVPSFRRSGPAFLGMSRCSSLSRCNWLCQAPSFLFRCYLHQNRRFRRICRFNWSGPRVGVLRSQAE